LIAPRAAIFARDKNYRRLGAKEITKPVARRQPSGKSSFKMRSAGVWAAFVALQALQHGTQLPRVDVPPRATGMT